MDGQQGMKKGFLMHVDHLVLNKHFFESPRLCLKNKAKPESSNSVTCF